MEHYQLSEVKSMVVDPFSQFPLDRNVVLMRVQPQSKMQNLLGYAMNKMKVSYKWVSMCKLPTPVFI